MFRRTAPIFAPIMSKRIHGGRLRYPPRSPTTTLAGRFTKLEADVNTRFTKPEADVAKEVCSKIEKLEHSMRDQLAGCILKQEEFLQTLYLRSLFGVIGASMLLVGAPLVHAMTESRRLDNEIKKRVIIRRGG